MEGQKQAHGHDDRKTVLIVEDERQLRRLIIELFTRAGYHVLEAACAEDARQLAERYSSPIHMLVTDVRMPGMGGPRLMDLLRQDRPQILVLFLSGYGQEMIGERIQHPGVAFLAKPFTALALLEKTQELLSGLDYTHEPGEPKVLGGAFGQ